MLSTKAGNYHSQKWTILRSKYADNSCSIILHDFDDFILFLFIIVAWLFLTIFSMKYQVSPIKILKLSGHSVSPPEQFLRVRKLRLLPWNLRNEQSHFFTLYCAPPLRKIFKPFLFKPNSLSSGAVHHLAVLVQFAPWCILGLKY